MTRKEHDIIYRLGSAGATARTGAPPVLEEATSGPAGVGPSGLPPMIASAIFEIAAWVRSLHSSQPNALAGYRLAGIDAVVLSTQHDPSIKLKDLREAVRRVDGALVLEASGGVDLTTVRAIAETGVDVISVGALTHSAPVLDIGLDAL